MALQICQFCGDTKVVPGQRNAKLRGLCGKGTCRIKALEELEAADLLSPEETEELRKHRGGLGNILLAIVTLGGLLK